MSTNASPCEVAREWFEQLWIKRDPSAIHRLLAADGKGYMEQGVVVTGPEGFLPIFHALHNAFPDMQVTIEAVTGNDTDACLRWHITATHGGDGLGIPATGKKLSWRGMTWFKVKDGIITEGWDCWNQGALMAELTKA